MGLLEDVAYRAGMSQTQFSRVWIMWLDFIHSKFRAYPIWPSKSSIVKTMPTCFEEAYPTTRVGIDYIEKPTSVRSQSAIYLNYKHYSIAKGFLGITAAASVSFMSDLYTGRTSDKMATHHCKLYTLLEEGDLVMGNKRFDMDNDLHI